MKKYFFFFFFLAAIDQLSKFFAIRGKITGPLLNFACNRNIAWSIPVAPGIFYFLWITIFLLLIYFFLKSKHQLERTALILILSGAISNLADRIARGCVVDFIDLKFWPAFNLADIYITIGVMALLIIKILNPKH